MVRDDQSPSLLCSQRKQHTSAAKPKPRRLEHSVSPWASLSLSMPSVRKQKPVSAQKQTSLSRPTAISFQASPAHTLPACSDASPASTPPNKRRCIPWHQAEITLSAQHKKQPMLASLTSSFEAGRNNSKQRTVLSTSRTARQSSDHASCVSRRHQHSPVWCLADAGAATRAVDDEAEDVLLTRAKDISLTVRDRLKRASRRMPNQMRRLVAGAVAGTVLAMTTLLFLYSRLLACALYAAKLHNS